MPPNPVWEMDLASHSIEGSCLEVALTKKAKNPEVTKKLVFIDALVISTY